MISVSVIALARSGGRASASLATAARRSLATTHSPTFTGEVYKDSEKARENMFFSKEDEKSMRKLLTKMKSQADVGSDAAPHSAAEESALLAIVGKHKMSEGDIKALYAWRHSHLF